MNTFTIVVITALAIHAINLFVYEFSDAGDKLSTFLVYYPLFFLCTPIRRHKTYNASCKYYQKNQVSYWRYMILGRRALRRNDDDETPGEE